MKCYLFGFFTVKTFGSKGSWGFCESCGKFWWSFDIRNDKSKAEVMKMLLGGKPSNYHLPITIQKLAVYTVSLPLFGFFFCIITSFIYNFEVHISSEDCYISPVVCVSLEPLLKRVICDYYCLRKTLV